MKSKVIIENGNSTIILEPENEFEEELLKTAESEAREKDVSIHFNSEYSMGIRDNHRIEIKIRTKYLEP